MCMEEHLTGWQVDGHTKHAGMIHSTRMRHATMDDELLFCVDPCAVLLYYPDEAE